MSNKIQKIKEEIERQIEEGKLKCQQSQENNDHESFVAWSEHVATCGKLLVFINSLPEEPASENKSEKELSETYLATFDKKYPILPTLKGKQKADFKNFLNKCQQEFGLKEFGIHPTQSKLFEKLTLLWATWGAEHLGGLGESNEYEFDKEPASEDLELEEEITRYYKSLGIIENAGEIYEWDDMIANTILTARHFAEWQKQEDEKLLKEDTWNYIEEYYPDITKEEKLRLYDISIKSRLAGANTIKQKMMKDAVDATILDVDAQTIEFGLWPEKLLDIKEGDKVKIILIKEN